VTVEDVRQIEPRLHQLEETPIASTTGDIIGWMVTAVTLDRLALGSGCHQDRNTARRIAVAELLERACVNEIKKAHKASDEFKDLLLSDYPTTCGFAAGFEAQKTCLRSVTEAFERWVWSKWIDELFYINKVHVANSSLTALAKYFVSDFVSVDFYEIGMKFSLPNGNAIEVKFGAVIAQDKSEGVYPGSRVCTIADDPWEHALLEAWRHLQLAQQMEQESPTVHADRPIFQRRVLHFAQHGDLALTQVAAAHKPLWPNPTLRVHARVPCRSNDFFLWRSLMSNFVGWDQGPIERFVY
jgi:hypothetical protein